jgi:lysophospholipase L1-like esterase
MKPARPLSALLATLALSAVVACSSNKNSKLTIGTGTDTGSETAARTDTATSTAGGSKTEPAPQEKPPPLTASVTIHVAGDSTAAVFPATDPTGRVGWAAVLQQFFAEGVKVDDAAKSGRSSKSFIDEGLWGALKARIQPGDYVFIGFGHNDEKPDPARHTDAATSFRDNLKTYIGETRAAGGFAVLLTPISRRKFEGSAISETHGAYPAAILAVGREMETPVLDLTRKTRVLLERLGPEATAALFAVRDDTHLSALGAPEVAKLVVQGIRELRLPLSERLAP